MNVFEVWAPVAQTVSVVVDGSEYAMAPSPEPHRPGWWVAEVGSAGHGSDYAFRVDGGDPTPDPRSPWQPNGVHAASRVYDHRRFEWHDTAWRGIAYAGAVFYELHVGTFTPEGTFDAAVEHLDHLVSLGVDVVELLPCNGFDGARGWGYDGVDLFTVYEPYGGPEGLKRFVDACHGRGLAVVMDAVYNHLGPSGNYLSRFGPYFTDKHSTPWGSAVNLDAAGSDEVRRFIVDNALMWLRDYHCDGLRLDAVHALKDERAVHLLEQLAMTVDALGAAERRPFFLVAESDLNDPRLIRPRAAGGYGLQAQWCDDIHHALWATLSGERQGYYCDFGSYAVLAKALDQGFVHDGDWSTFRGRTHGRRPEGVMAPQLVAYLQDHDQIGNRATGDRASATLSDGLLQVGAALLLLSPFTPMFFMGEEWGARTPWQFFSDHAGELGTAVSEGRRREFAEHGWSDLDVPDPQALRTFTDSKLDWSEPATERGQRLIAWNRALIELRHTEEALADLHLGRASFAYDEDAGWFTVTRGHHAKLTVAANLAAEPQVLPVHGEVVLASDPDAARLTGDGLHLPAESVAVIRRR